MGRRLEVRITYCCCCGLTIAAALIALYTLIIYCVFLGLASSAVNRIDRGLPDPQPYSSDVLYERQLDQETRLIVEVDPYYDSLGLYTEELKYEQREVRRAVLGVNIGIFLAVIIASILVLVGLCTNIEWLLLPWIIMMIIDIIRGLISVIIIFVYADGHIRQIAVGIFFLGLQLFHMALVIIMFAKFQRMYNKKRGIDYKLDRRHGERSILMDGGSQVYPTLTRSANTFGGSSTLHPEYQKQTLPPGQQPIYIHSQSQASGPPPAEPAADYRRY